MQNFQHMEKVIDAFQELVKDPKYQKKWYDGQPIVFRLNNGVALVQREGTSYSVQFIEGHRLNITLDHFDD